LGCRQTCISRLRHNNSFKPSRIARTGLTQALYRYRVLPKFLPRWQLKTNAFIFALLLAPLHVHAQRHLPILDMHLHASAADEQGPPPMAMCTPITKFTAWDPVKSSYTDVFKARVKQPPCPNPVWSPMTDEAVMLGTIAAMKKLNIIGVLSGSPDRVATWRAAAPDRFLPALAFQIGHDHLSPEQIRALHASGKLTVLGEVTNQYAGIAPDDPRMEPYWALAEELDIPVGIHVGTGPPGVIYLGSTGYRARLHSALTMEEVLVRHPKLRVYIMHAGYPMLDDMLAVLYAHPQVYVDVGVIVYTQPRAAFYRYLQVIVDSGFGNRVMFGSDQMVWPGVIERAVDVIKEAPFLSAEQKRDILYNNAARFLRLSDAAIAKHHQQ
jgi:predicted TIM-barrel fold metal-dependent hydrolase